MKPFCLLFLLFTLIVPAASPQTKSIDSLRQLLPTQKEDSNKVKILNQIAQKSNDLNVILEFSNQAKALSEKLRFNIGRGKACWNIAYVYFHQANYIESRKFFEESLISMQSVDNKLGIGDAYRGIGDCYTKMNNRTEAIKNYRSALEALKSGPDKMSIVQVYLVLGGYYFDEGNYPVAIENYYSALKLTEESNNKFFTGLTLSALADAYATQGDFAEGLKISEQASMFFKEIKDTAYLAANYFVTGKAYYGMGNYEQSLKVYTAALNLETAWEKSGPHNIGVTIQSIYGSMANVYLKQGELINLTEDKIKSTSLFGKAENNYLRSLELYDSNSKSEIAATYLGLGKVYIHLGNTSRALSFTKKSLQLGEEIRNKEVLKNAYNQLASLDSLDGNYKLAFADYKTYISYRDSLVNDQSTKKIEQTKLQYEFDKKDALVKADQEKKDAMVRRQRILEYSALTIFFLMAAFLFMYSRQKQKAKAKIEQAFTKLKLTQAQLIQKEKMASLGELTAGIAHEIQNPLNFVNNFSRLNTELLEEAEQEISKGNIEEASSILVDIQENEKKIAHHGDRAASIVRGMLQHSQKSTGEKIPVNLNVLADEYFKLAYHGVRAKDKNFTVTLKTDLDNSIGPINMVPQDIGRVLLNLYNNAFFAVNEKGKQTGEGYEPIVLVSTRKESGRVIISVKDNGIGIPQYIIAKIFQPFFTTKPTGQGTGLGLSLSYDIIKAAGGEIDVNSTEGKYSEFTVRYPC